MSQSPTARTVGGGSPSAKPIELLLADSQPIALEAMARVFAQPPFTVIAACGSCEEALAVLRHHTPAVVVFDLDVPPDGLVILRHVTRYHPETKTVLFAPGDDPRIQEALDLGVRGMVPKELPAETLVRCVTRVHAGERWVARRAPGPGAAPARPPRAGDEFRLPAELTARETEIVLLVARGLSNKEIAKRLAVKEGTLKIHLHNIYRKLAVDSRVALTLYVQRRSF